MQSFLFAVDEVSGYAGLAGSVVNLGFAATVGWYMLTKALPKMQETFARELSAQRLEASTTEKERRAEAARELVLHRQEAREALKQVIEHCERETSRSDKAMVEGVANCMEELGRVMEDNRLVMEEVRELMRELRSAMNNQPQRRNNLPKQGGQQ